LHRLSIIESTITVSVYFIGKNSTNYYCYIRRMYILKCCI